MSSFFSACKQCFIPHDGNGYKPYLFRKKGVRILLGLIIGAELLFLLQNALLRLPLTSYLASVFPSAVVQLTNQEREIRNLKELAVNPLLEKAAQMKAEDMAQKGYFAHVSPSGETPWVWLDRAGYAYAAAGENLAVHFFDSKDLVNAWMDSPGHSANILQNEFTETGIGIATGTPRGSERATVFIVQFFGVPSVVSLSSAALMKEGAKENVPQSVRVQTLPKNSAAKPPVQPSEISSGAQAKEKLSSSVSQQETSENAQGTVISARSDLTVTRVPSAFAFAEATADKSEETPAAHISYFFHRFPTMARLVLSSGAFALPKTLSETFSIFLFVFVSVAFALAILIKIRVQHTDVMLYGAGILAFAAIALMANQWMMPPGRIG